IHQGVEINGVAPAFPGWAPGLVAEIGQELDYAGGALVTAMFAVDCIPQAKFIEGISIHKPTAAFLTHRDLGHLKRFELWRKVWPSR
ncbi:hypothetical protein V8E54_006832, partial [Elaphomyces granulatus]